MKPNTLDTLVWVLIYGGLLTLSLAVFVGGTSPLLGWGLGVAGALATVAGVVLVWVRSRKPG
jgi:hypothetical protein